MPNDIVQVRHTSGQTVYFLVWDQDGKVLDVDGGTGTFVTYSTANFLRYDTDATEQGTSSQVYNGTFPAQVTSPGRYRIVWRQEVGPRDETDTVVSVGEVDWNGSRLMGLRQPFVDLALDHLVSDAVVGADVADNSIVAKLASKSATADWDTFDNTTESLEGLRDQFAPLAPLRSGTLQAGSTASTAKLDVGASAVDDYYKNSTLCLTGGTGNEQCRLITAYNGTTKVATISPDWETTPDVTSTFSITPGIVHSETLSTTSIAASIWDEPRASHTAVGTFGEGTVISPDGLDSISTSEPVGIPGNWREQQQWLYMQKANKSTLTSTLFTVFAADNSTVVTQQTVSSDGVTEELAKVAIP